MNPVKQNKILRMAVFYLMKYKILVFITLLLLIVASLFEGFGIGMIIPILESVSNAGSDNFFTKYASFLCNFLGFGYDLVSLLVIFASFMLLRYIFSALAQSLIRVFSSKITYNLRKDAFRNLMDLPLSFYYETRIGDTVSTLYTSSENAGASMEHFMVMLTGLIFSLIYLILNCIISVPLTFIAGMLAVGSYFLITPRFKRGLERGQQHKILTDSINSFLFDKLSGIKIIKAFNNERFHIKAFEGLIRQFREVSVHIQNNRIIANFFLEPFIGVLAIGLLIFSVRVLHLSVILLITFFFIFMRFLPQVRVINSNYLMMLEYLPHFMKVEDIIRKEGKTYLKPGTRLIREFVSKIELRDVWFKYPKTNDYVLKGTSSFIEKNKITALVGGSGGGKTTLIDLILRHHDPDKGSIFVDRIDLSEIKRQSWHRLVSAVDQENYLFNDTIYNNILYGSLEAAKDDVFNAARLANAHEFISALPDGYGTIVGERGMKLSGGQKQRIALARALIRDPDILILDEATSALDSESERLIQDSIENLSRSKTIIIIAHRLSTISRADKIIVIENGEILEEGTKDELLSRAGIYKRYHTLQEADRDKDE